MRGAYILSDLDHHLLMAALRLSLKTFDNTTNKRTKYNVCVLKTRTVFYFRLSNKFQSLQDQSQNDDTNIET